MPSTHSTTALHPKLRFTIIYLKDIIQCRPSVNVEYILVVQIWKYSFMLSTLRVSHVWK
jgi:hypothetical protein